ncbi:50S ribosomal protein L10 [archaeon]|nr:50S ribosomal protein L10 [archaeon]
MRESINQKKKLVVELAAELSKAERVALVSLNRLPARQLKSLREDEGLDLRISSKNIVKRALEKADKGLEKLIDYFKGSCALLFPKKDVFKLSIELSKKREPAFAKRGMTVKKDVVLDEGPTQFMPGELMTELTEMGVKVSPKGGKITIMEPSIIVKRGEQVSKQVADLLFKLGVKPVTTGLELVAAYDNGSIFTSKELDIDVEEFMNNLLNAHAGALNLAYNTNMVNKLTIKLLLRRAFSQASNLAREAGFLTKSNVNEVLAMANARAGALVKQIKWEVKG